MAYKVIFTKDAHNDLKGLDKSIRTQVIKKAIALQENPFLGNPLGNKFGLDLTGYYKIYVAKKAYRIVYHLIGEQIEVVEIVGIGRRDKEEVYRLAVKRLKGIVQKEEDKRGT
ncbi:MAG: type II toxin-antitoxin system RelE/ParE family toxin [Proteobacteria bacterium]|nr:type II toxin-antitoxin system RelE/ParE family toxin [Pseudomonadota bacterium]